MKNNIKISACLLAMSSSLIVSESAFAKDGTPKVFGNLIAGVQKVQGQDIDGQAFEASLGVKGLYKQDDFTLVYKLEAEFSDAANHISGKSDIKVKNALVALPSKHGTLIIAPRVETGVKKEVYKPLNIFEINETDNSTGLWGQADIVSSVVAYKTPKFNNTHVVAAIITLPLGPAPGSINSNGEDVDAWSVRAIHQNENLYLAGSIVATSDTVVNMSDDYNRYMLSGSYQFDNVKIGAGWEINDFDVDAADYDVMGIVADVSFGSGWSAGIGYTDRNAENDANDNQAVTAIVRKQLTKNVFSFVEFADYDKNSGVVADNFNIGINVKF